MHLSAQAQVQWPAVTTTMKPWARWWWEGSAVTKEGLSINLRKYKAAGLGGLELTPIYGVKGEEQNFIPFLSPLWVQMFQYTLNEAANLDLGIDMATGTGWPFGGPWVTPEDACKNVRMNLYTLREGERLKEPVRFVQQPFVKTVSGAKVDIRSLSYPIATNKNLQGYAFDQVQYEKLLPLQTLIAYNGENKRIDLTNKVDAAGKLHWQAPAGTWTLYALFMGWHGKLVERAAPGGEGDAIDHFSAKALNHYLHAFDTALAGKDLSHLRAFFNDSYEVDDAKGQSTWTPDFLQEFKARCGYDLRAQLPALYQKDTREKNSRVLYEYRKTISELLLEKFTRPWHAWAKKQGKMIRNQSHGSPANILDLYAAIDIPETEGDDILRYKFATSAAHVTGKPLASSESATWLNEHFLSSLGEVKIALDKFFVGGVNHVFYHGTNYSPPNEPWPGWLFYASTHFTPANPMWKDFGTLNAYVTRVQSFLQQGRPDNDVLVYFPFNDKISEPGKELLLHFDGMKGFKHSVFEAASNQMLASGYSFDMISDQQLLGVNVEGGRLATANVHYQTLLIPDVKYMPLETLQQLVKLARAGATIMCLNHLPEDVPGYGDLAKRQAAFRGILDELHFVHEEDLDKAAIGNGVVLMGNDLSLLLTAANVRREPLVDPGLRFVRRTIGQSTVYFMTNPLEHSFQGYIHLATPMAGAALYDPMTGKSGLARMKGGGKEGPMVYLSLQPGESCILQTSMNRIAGNAFPYADRVGRKQEIKGSWTLRFLSGGPVIPSPLIIDKPGSWTDMDDEELQYFSGTASYSIDFKKPAGAAKRWLFDLGKVGESAEVLLNGKKLGTLLGPVYQLQINAGDFKPINHLELRITNSMANRIIYLEKNKVPWKHFYNINMPAKFKENRGPDGLLDAAGWKPKPSGLLTPVTLAPILDNR